MVGLRVGFGVGFGVGVKGWVRSRVTMNVAGWGLSVVFEVGLKGRGGGL